MLTLPDLKTVAHHKLQDNIKIITSSGAMHHLTQLQEVVAGVNNYPIKLCSGHIIHALMLLPYTVSIHISFMPSVHCNRRRDCLSVASRSCLTGMQGILLDRNNQHISLDFKS